MFGVGLRTDRDIFSRRHGHGAGDQTSHTRKQDIALGAPGRGHAENETCGRDDAVVCPEHGCTQPSDSFDKMALFVKATHGSAWLHTVLDRA